MYHSPVCRRYSDHLHGGTRSDITALKKLLEQKHHCVNECGTKVSPLHRGSYRILEGSLQTYLELPLSNIKLNLSTFAYLAGWQEMLLSPDGRIILLNSVLDGLPIYVMAMLLLLKGVVKALDKRRRAFL